MVPDDVMRFGLIAGNEPAAKLPTYRADGSIVPADNAAAFDLAHAAEKSGRAIDTLRQVWIAVLGQFFAQPATPRATDAPAPSATAAKPAGAASIDLMKRDILRRRFPELVEHLFDEYLFQCQQRRLDPWSNIVFPKVIADERGDRRVEVLLTIHGFRMIAHATKQYAGCDRIQFEYDADGNITEAESTVYRLVNGNRCAFIGVVRMAEYAGIPSSIDTEFRKQMPHVWLGKCAQAEALRNAFEELAGVYVPEEMWQVEERRRRAATTSANPSEDEPQHIDDDYSQLPEPERRARATRLAQTA